jgi:hypothetical protein
MPQPSSAAEYEDAWPGFDGSAYDKEIEGWLGTDLDAWTRRVVRRHFDPQTGSPYWLARAAGLSFDPMEITRYADLVRFGPFPLADLREGDPLDMVPRSTARPLSGRVWDSGGTTGAPCRVYYTEAMLRYRAVWRRWSWVAEGFQPGRTWLNAAPGGPHLIGHGAAELAEHFAALVFGIDMDPRWVKHLIRNGRLAEVDDYTGHLVEQITDVLAHQPVQYMNTTPAVFHALTRHRPDLVAGLDGVRMSGTQITVEMRRDIRAALDGGICGISYGNTFGISAHLPGEGDEQTIVYAPTYPQVTSTVVDRDEWTRVVAFGSIGQVRMTVLQDDLFLPNILERDQAVRYDLGGRWPCDGVANVKPLQVTRAAPEGLY